MGGWKGGCRFSAAGWQAAVAVPRSCLLPLPTHPAASFRSTRFSTAVAAGFPRPPPCICSPAPLPSDAHYTRLTTHQCTPAPPLPQFPACAIGGSSSPSPSSSPSDECWLEEGFHSEQEGLVVFDGGSYSLGPAAIGAQHSHSHLLPAPLEVAEGGSCPFLQPCPTPPRLAASHLASTAWRRCALCPGPWAELAQSVCCVCCVVQSPGPLATRRLQRPSRTQSPLTDSFAGPVTRTHTNTPAAHKHSRCCFLAAGSPQEAPQPAAPEFDDDAAQAAAAALEAAAREAAAAAAWAADSAAALEQVGEVGGVRGEGLGGQVKVANARRKVVPGTMLGGSSQSALLRATLVHLCAPAARCFAPGKALLSHMRPCRRSAACPLLIAGGG